MDPRNERKVPRLWCRLCARNQSGHGSSQWEEGNENLKGLFLESKMLFKVYLSLIIGLQKHLFINSRKKKKYRLWQLQYCNPYVKSWQNITQQDPCLSKQGIQEGRDKYDICYLQPDILQKSFEHKLFSMQQVSQRQDTVGWLVHLENHSKTLAFQTSLLTFFFPANQLFSRLKIVNHLMPKQNVAHYKADTLAMKNAAEKNF